MPNNHIGIYFFGGYLATEDDVLAWTHSMQLTPSVSVTAFPWPRGATAGAPLAEWHNSHALASDIVARVREGHDHTVYLVGHSSGCAIANDVFEHLRDNLNAENADWWRLFGPVFHLVALDGFCPAPHLLALPNTQVWSAINGNIRSLNYGGLSQRAGDKFRVYHTHQRLRWPLHFSLVNLNASDEHSGLSEGYHDCNANSCWLQQSAVTS